MRLNNNEKIVFDLLEDKNGIDWSALRGRCYLTGNQFDVALNGLLRKKAVILVAAYYKGCQNEIYFPMGTGFRFGTE